MQNVVTKHQQLKSSILITMASSGEEETECGEIFVTQNSSRRKGIVFCVSDAKKELIDVIDSYTRLANNCL